MRTHFNLPYDFVFSHKYIAHEGGYEMYDTEMWGEPFPLPHDFYDYPPPPPQNARGNRKDGARSKNGAEEAPPRGKGKAKGKGRGKGGKGARFAPPHHGMSWEEEEAAMWEVEHHRMMPPHPHYMHEHEPPQFREHHGYHPRWRRDGPPPSFGPPRGWYPEEQHANPPTNGKRENAKKKRKK